LRKPLETQRLFDVATAGHPIISNENGALKRRFLFHWRESA
jgi:hypothetical protein